MHHPSERHPFAELLAGYCHLLIRVFGPGSMTPVSRKSARARLKALAAIVKLGVGHIQTIILTVLPPLQDNGRRTKALRALVLDEVTSRLCHPLIMPITRDVHGVDDAAFAETAATFRDLRPRHFGGLTSLRSHFWLDESSQNGPNFGRVSSLPYAPEIKLITHLEATYSTRRKLNLLTRVLDGVQQRVWSHHGVRTAEEQLDDANAKFRLAADDLVSIMTYAISQAAPSLHLCSELAFIEGFADEGPLLGNQGYVSQQGLQPDSYPHVPQQDPLSTPACGRAS